MNIFHSECVKLHNCTLIFNCRKRLSPRGRQGSGVSVVAKEHKLSLSADEILQFLSNSESSVPSLADIIHSSGKFSEYKRNFSKSLALLLRHPSTQVINMSSFPFKVSDSCFTYWGINITPMICQLSKVSFIPLLDKICVDLIRWSDLPLSWLG